MLVGLERRAIHIEEEREARQRGWGFEHGDYDGVPGSGPRAARIDCSTEAGDEGSVLHEACVASVVDRSKVQRGEREEVMDREGKTEIEKHKERNKQMAKEKREERDREREEELIEAMLSRGEF